ncbi:MAG: hypothetical protein R2809_15170 [Flavobacteriales bacterium]
MDRKKIIDTCTSIIQSKIDGVQEQLSELRKSAESESKSTSGDKHETGRAMIHLEQEQLMKQLGELNNQMSQIIELKNSESKPNIHSGSIVHTNLGVFFFGVALGKVQLEDTAIMVISLASPLGKLFLGKTKDDTITFGTSTYSILQVD